LPDRRYFVYTKEAEIGVMEAVFFKQALLPGGWADHVRLVFEAGRIRAVETETRPQTGDDIAEIGLPGAANLHSHAFQRGMAGLAEVRGPGSDSFWTWREVMYRFVGRMTPDDLEVVATQAYLEMLEAGFTRVGEFHYLHHDVGGVPFTNLAETAERIVAAADETGINLTLLPAFYAHGGFGGRPPNPEQARFTNDLDRFADLFEKSRDLVSKLPGVSIGVAPHSLRAVTGAELNALVILADDRPIHIHIAEQMKEVTDCVAFSGARPVEWLLSNQRISQRWCLIHATHMTSEELESVAKAGAIVGLCPITEANLGDGIFCGKQYIAAGGHFGVGTDSNVLISLAEELRLFEYSQRLKDQARNVVSRIPGESSGRALFEQALFGHRALGIEKVGFTPGAFADIVSFDGEHSAFCGRNGDFLLDAFVFAAQGGGIDGVWSRGRKVVIGGQHRNRTVISSRFRETMKRLLTQ
jgi:formimidoylglutamate deiminase